jgi:hypothetical protein
MKTRSNAHTRPATRLTEQILRHLQAEGFRFVLVKLCVSDKRMDYLTRGHYTLVPVKNLPEKAEEKEIFEPIDSKILLHWARYDDGRDEVFIEKAPPEVEVHPGTIAGQV